MKTYDSDGREYTPSQPKIEELKAEEVPTSSTTGLNEPGAAESAVSPSEPAEPKE